MLIAAAALAVAPACGDDDDGAQDDDEPEGEPCLSAGRAETCRCSSNQPPGYRQCTDDLIWTACTCEPEGDAGNRDCRYPGQEVMCWPCPGESVGRMTVCLQNRTFDCSCRGDGGSSRDGG